MRTYLENTLADLYPQAIEDVLTLGHVVAPRGRPNVELRPVVWTTRRWACLRKAGVSYKLACAEAMAVVAGWDDVAWLERFRVGMGKLQSDNGLTFHGAYGPRLAGQVPQALDVLQADPQSRQVVLCIWNEDDLGFPSKDLPCNTQLLLKLRRGRLHMTVVRRSADLIWGVPYDHHVFWALLHVLSAALVVHPGFLTEVIDSLHIYKPEAEFYDSERVTKAKKAVARDVPHPWPGDGTWDENVAYMNRVRSELINGKLETELGRWLYR